MAAYLLDPEELRARFPEVGPVGEHDVAALAPGSGYAYVRYLGFDSDLFGLKVGRVTMGGDGARLESLCYARGLAQEAGFRQLLATVDARAREKIRALEQAGFALIDVGVTFRHALKALPEPEDLDGVSVRAATEDDIEALREAAATLFLRSRFYFDPAYTRGAADELHRRWIENCVRGRAEVVLVADVAGELAGFFTCGLDGRVGKVELVGVVPAFSGRGIGRLLTRRALAWFAERADEVRVKTQVTNFGAAALYTTNGFRLFESDLTYRLSLPDVAEEPVAQEPSETPQ